MNGASRGEVWLVDFGTTRGHEQKGKRPALILSVDDFNRGPSGLLIVLPMTSRDRRIVSHVRVNPPEGGLKSVGFIMCENIRSISARRLVERWGRAGGSTVRRVEDVLLILLDL